MSSIKLLQMKPMKFLKIYNLDDKTTHLFLENSTIPYNPVLQTCRYDVLRWGQLFTLQPVVFSYQYLHCAIYTFLRMGQLCKEWFLKLPFEGDAYFCGNWNTTNVQLHKEPFSRTWFKLYHVSNVFQWRGSSPYWLVPQADAILTYAEHFILNISLRCINLLKYLEKNT